MQKFFQKTSEIDWDDQKMWQCVRLTHLKTKINRQRVLHKWLEFSSSCYKCEGIMSQNCVGFVNQPLTYERSWVSLSVGSESLDWTLMQAETRLEPLWSNRGCLILSLTEPALCTHSIDTECVWNHPLLPRLERFHTPFYPLLCCQYGCHCWCVIKTSDEHQLDLQ